MSDLSLGAHMSIAGGLDLSVKRGASVDCKVIQIFSKQSNQWHSKKLTEQDREKLGEAQKETGVVVAAIHDSYLINLASPFADAWKKSISAFKDEVERAGFLGVPSLVFHPGSHLKTGEEAGILRVAEGLNIIFEETSARYYVKILIENTAGQGTNLGYRFEHIRDIIANIKPDYQDRMGFCLDTCHLFASGYDISSEAMYEETISRLDSVVGLERGGLIHLNDSKKPFGSRVDRHEHIGKGFIGATPFRFLLHDSRLNHLPMVLETPKGKDMHEDVENLKTLRKIAGET